MSRSNPTETSKNPSTRWFEWKGGQDGGFVAYYDKAANKNIDAGSKFVFLPLDELSCVKGWHDASDSGISSNEVRDTKKEPLVVKAFKGGTLAEGFYSQIRDRIQSQGGHFVSNIYIAYKDEAGQLKLGAIQFKGAALNAWVEFKKANRAGIYAGAIKIDGYTEGTKGRVKFRVPKFFLLDTTPETDAAAKKIDAEILQPYLAEYFKRNAVEQIHAPEDAENAVADAAATEKKEDSEIPF